ncbi:MAG: response regulator [Chthoniobacterales bacterium]
MKNNRLLNEEAAKPGFSTRLNQLMRRRHLKAAALAREIGISHVAVKNYLEGRIPDTKLLFQLAKYFGVSMEYLLTGSFLDPESATSSPPEARRELFSDATTSLKGSLVSVMNYEFRAPLNGILGFTDLLSESDLSKEQLEHVNMIRESGDILLRKLNDLLEIAGTETACNAVNTPEETTPAAESENRRKALIVEDDATSRKLLIRMLKNFGIEADCASNGHTCLEMHRAAPYDLIFMDVRLPEMDGVETTRRIREIERNSDKKTNIIAITAQAMAGDLELCLAAGMDEYLSKPVRLNEIERIVTSYTV